MKEESLPEPTLQALVAVLLPVARAGGTLTYQELAGQLGLVPPLTIKRVTRALEALLAADASAGRAPLAAIAVSRTRGGLPAPGFFERLVELGLAEATVAAATPEAVHQRLHQKVVAAARAGVWDTVDF